MKTTTSATAGFRRPHRPMWRRMWVAALVALLTAPLAHAEGLLGSKHDLSAASTNTLRAATETGVCIFCHTPHRALEAGPLWNHELSTASYIPYTSSTLKALAGQPTGASKLCLSCHDGTVALGSIHSQISPIEMRSGVNFIPAGPRRLGTDLSDDHPVSFKYDSALAALNGQLQDPATLNQEVRLDHDGMLQCTACHDPHNDKYRKFLVKDDRSGQLCVACHSPNGWTASIHATSAQTWNGTGPNPWPNTPYNNVADNACANCHASHTAGTPARLLNSAIEEQNCYPCHSGTVAAKNIAAAFGKFSTHPVTLTAGVHDPLEDPINPPRHVECADCHNSHAATTAAAVAPNASGALAGLKGVNADGVVVNPLTKEYEQCFRCHADSIARGPARVARQFVETNTRLEFAPTAASYHPIAAPGKNSNVPSLIAPWTTTSQMYCTDCHNNDQGPNNGGTGANGPHGSAFPPILEQNLTLVDGNPESAVEYALCYKCHSRSSILADQSFSAVNGGGLDRGHRFHIVDQNTACTTCHDPHGVTTQPRLINFRTGGANPVTPSSGGRLEFNSTGVNKGNCYLSCHGKDHNPESY